ncbi:MAG: peptidoglycan-binding protein [Patescibacteria group bacterium]
MLKRIAFAGVGVALLVSPLLASADTVSDLQTQIGGLLAQLKQLQSQLTQQQGANSTTNGGKGVGTAVPASLYPVDPVFICPAFKRVLMYGVSGDDVVQLQKFLASQGLLSNDSATGFFGRVTEAAVQKLQAANGIVSSGDRATTGWGLVGPGTRAWLLKRCGGGGGNQNFSASPTSGKAPLAVTFTASFITRANASNYSVDFGEGYSGGAWVPDNADCEISVPPTGGGCPGRFSAGHTYNTTGIYTAKLIYQPPAPPCNAPPGAACTMVLPPTKVVGTVTINVGAEPKSCPIYNAPLCGVDQQLVGGGIGSDGCQLGPRCVPKTPTTSGAPSISGLDAPASLAVGQLGTWTVHASVGNNANTNLRYSVVWGDESVLDQLNAFAGDTAGTLQASALFAHAYANAGTYRPTFTVSNSVGSAQTSASVRVGGSDDDGGGGGDGGNSTFSVSPTYGTAPLAVIFRSNIMNGLDAYTINFGDGSSGTLQNNCQTGYGACGLATASHTYAANGTYTATLRKPNNCESSNQGGCTGVTDIIVGTVTIVVGGTVSSGNLSATPKEGAAPLMVTFTGVGNSISFGDGNPALVAAGGGNLGTVTHVYRTYGEYKAESGNASVNINVTYNRFVSFGGALAPALCVYNNRTYASGLYVDVPVRGCGRGDSIAFKMCFGAASQAGGSSEIVSQRYTCTNGEWVDQYGGYTNGEPISATSCRVLGGMTVADGQMVAQSYGAIGWQFDYLSAFRKTLTQIKCVRGEWFQCDVLGGNCTVPADAPSVIGYEVPISASGTNANLANALTALESALKALIIKLAQ